MAVPTPQERLAELLREVERHQAAIREFGLAGYVTMVERHKRELAEVYETIRGHCRSSGLPLPPRIPRE